MLSIYVNTQSVDAMIVSHSNSTLICIIIQVFFFVIMAQKTDKIFTAT